MIYFIEGNIDEVGSNFVIIEASGIGYKIYIPSNFKLAVVGEHVKIYTFLQIKDNSWELYGFQTTGDLDLFETLISVSGIGPKLGLNILNATGSDVLKKAIMFGDESLLVSIGGVGQKLAKRIILELQSKAKEWSFESQVTPEDKDVLDALISFGHSPQNARDAILKIPSDLVGVESRLKSALKILNENGK